MIEKVLIWARGATLDGAYSRDRVVYRLLAQAGVRFSIFSPLLSATGDIEAALRRLPHCDAIWVPTFRHRDVAAASRYARRRGVPLIFDPLISAYDKQVNEREKFATGSRAARHLLARERALFARADIVIADTAGHAEYFRDVLGVPTSRLVVLPVGADESVFGPHPPRRLAEGERVRVLFYGSFIRLHGVPTIVEAIKAYRGPPLEFRLIGTGPMRAEAEAALAAATAGGHAHAVVHFEDWLPIEALSARIAEADIVLGIFGTTAKALRVVPNKVYQALAVGRPVITSDTPAFDTHFHRPAPGPIGFVPPGDPLALAAALAQWASAPGELGIRAAAAARLFRERFAEARLGPALVADLAACGVGPFPGEIDQTPSHNP